MVLRKTEDFIELHKALTGDLPLAGVVAADQFRKQRARRVARRQDVDARRLLLPMLDQQLCHVMGCRFRRGEVLMLHAE